VNMKPLLSCVILSALLVPAMGSAQTASLEEIVEQAVLTNPEIRARFQDFKSSLEGQNVRRGALLPEVTAQGWTGREWRSKGSEPGERSGNWSRSGYSLQLRQLLFDGFSTMNDVKQLGFEKLSGYFELMATVDSLAAEATQAYLDVQRYREMEQLARDNYRLHQRTLEQLQERQASGVGRGVDLEQAHGRLSLAQTNLMTESGNLNDVTQRFQRIVGLTPPDTLLGSPEVSDRISTDDARVEQAIRNNPSLLSKQALVQAADAGVASAKGRHLPTLELRAATGKDKGEPGLPYRNARSSNVQLMLSYDLFRGGADQARVRQTKAQSYAAGDVRDYTCRNVQQELSVAWNNIVRLREQMPYLQEHERATAKVRIAYMQQFQIGERSLLDVLDTENELFDSRRALTNAIFDLKQAEYQWLAMAHELLPALSLSDPYDERLKEMDELDLPQQVVEVCRSPLPDTRNLKPVTMEYRDGNQPPVIVETKSDGAQD